MLFRSTCGGGQPELLCRSVNVGSLPGSEVGLARSDVTATLSAGRAPSAVAGAVVRVLDDERVGHAWLGHDQGESVAVRRGRRLRCGLLDRMWESVVGSSGRRNRVIVTLSRFPVSGGNVLERPVPTDVGRLRVQGSRGRPDALEAVHVGGERAVVSSAALLPAVRWRASSLERPCMPSKTGA